MDWTDPMSPVTEAANLFCGLCSGCHDNPALSSGCRCSYYQRLRNSPSSLDFISPALRPLSLFKLVGCLHKATFH